jgi:hypothetical protein
VHRRMRLFPSAVLAAIVVIAGLLLPGSAKADSFSVSQTDSFGTQYNLAANCNSTDTLCTVTLTLNTSGTGGAALNGATEINAVNFALGGITGPGTLTTNATGVWATAIHENIDSNGDGCNSPKGNSPFDCAEATSTSGFAALNGSTYFWTWTGVTFSSFTAADDHVGIKYNNGSQTLSGVITSDTVSVRTPEPSSVLLLGFALPLVYFARRRLGLTA